MVDNDGLQPVTYFLSLGDPEPLVAERSRSGVPIIGRSGRLTQPSTGETTTNHLVIVLRELNM